MNIQSIAEHELRNTKRMRQCQVGAKTERTSLGGRSQWGIKTGARWPGSTYHLRPGARYFTSLHLNVFIYKVEMTVNLSCELSVKIQRVNKYGKYSE